MNADNAEREDVLERQIARLDGRLQTLRQTSNRLSQLRLVLFLLAGAFLVSVFLTTSWISGALGFLFLAGFAAAVARHRRVERAVKRFADWRAIKQTHLARLRLDWAQMPPAQPVPPQFEHPFALDLDLIGGRSIHQWLDTAVTGEGSARLQAWLTAAAPDAAQTRRRQALARELARLPLFRDKLALWGGELAPKPGQKWPGQKLLDWLKMDESPDLRPALRGLWGLAAANWLLGAAYLLGWLPPLWVITWTVYAAWSLWQIRRVGPIFEQAFFLRDNLEQLGGVFGFLERGRVGQAALVRHLLAPFLQEGERPSAHLRRVNRVVTAVSLQKNPFLWSFLNLLLPWDISFAHQLGQARRALAQRLPGWLEVWFELEALSSLAGLAWRNPGFTWPEIAADGPIFTAAAIGHPLIPAAGRVCNDFRVDSMGGVALITGSNMAGKSSFLRALGVNLALAYAGGPVLADRLQTIPFRLFSSIRVTDSVTDGFSFFYAEVWRLKWLLDELAREGEPPLFFLIDEIFRGTNNRERLIGSRAYVRALAGQNGAGFIATHDLELVQLADEHEQIANYHFRDAVADGRMSFDYTLRPGPCPTTNALEIMRLAGLPVGQ